MLLRCIARWVERVPIFWLEFLGRGSEENGIMGYLESTTNITGSRKTVQKIVVTWSGWRDRILNQADVEGYGDVALFISEDRDDLMRELADADAVMAVVWNA